MAPPAKNFNPISDADIDPNSPGTTGLFTKIRDALEHLEEWLGKSFTAEVDHDHDGVNSKLVAGGFLFGDFAVDSTLRITTSPVTTFIDLPGASITVAAGNLPSDRTVFATAVGEGKRQSGAAGNLEVQLVADGTVIAGPSIITVTATTRFVGLVGSFMLNASSSPVVKMQFRNVGAAGVVEVTESHLVIKLAE